MTEHGLVGQKYIWCSNGSTCQFHGAEKRTWTFLDEHLMRDNSPMNRYSFDYAPGGAVAWWGSGIWLHRFSRSGAWKDAVHFWTFSDQGQSLVDFFTTNSCADDDYNCNEDIYVIFSIGLWVNQWTAVPMLPEAAQILDDFFGIDQSIHRFVIMNHNES